MMFDIPNVFDGNSRVIAGNYKNYIVMLDRNGLKLTNYKRDKILINKDTIARYEVMNRETTSDDSSIFGRAIIGDMLFGPTGAIVGGMSGKSKTFYTIAIEFKNGAKSLLQLDSGFYKFLMIKLFESNTEIEELAKKQKQEKKEQAKLERAERIETVKTAKSWEEKLCAIFGIKK